MAKAPRVTYPFRVDLYEPGEMDSGKTHGLPFRRLVFRGRKDWATGEDWNKINERLARVGYRLSKPLERDSLQPRGSYQWRAGASQMMDRNEPGRKPGRIGCMLRPLAIGPGPDEPVKSQGGVTVTDWPMGRPKGRENPHAERKVSAEERKLIRQIEKQRALVAALGKMAEAPKDRAGRKGRQKVSPAVKQEAVERYAAGEPLASIASDLGISTTTVSKAAVDAGMRRQQKITPSRKRKVVDLYRAGYSGHETAEATGLPAPTVYKILSQAGVTRPGEHGPITRSMALDAIRGGSSAMEVATSAGVSPATVAIWAEKAGLTVSKAWTGPTGVGKEKGDLMRALREQGFSYAEIGKRVGANASTVREHLASLLLPARAEGIKARRNPRKQPRGADKKALRRMMRL